MHLENGWFLKRQVSRDLVLVTEPHVHEIFRSNVWHLRGSQTDLVIDTGMGLANLSSVLDLTEGKPVLAIATHAHVDHVGSFHEFSDRAGPRIEAHAFATMDDRYTYANEFRALDEPLAVRPRPDWRVLDYALKPAPLTTILDEGDHVDTGDRIFSIVHLPGHSPGSIGLLDEKTGVFFSGDAIYDDELYDQLPDSDRNAYRSTMAKILDLNVSIIHGGHGASFGAARMHEIAREYLDSD